MMEPNNRWIDDWRYGVKPSLEKQTSEELIKIFQGFWLWANLDEKSKSTKQRYLTALHALGGYLVAETGNEQRENKDIEAFLRCYIDSTGAPLIHHDDERWQDELDTVCRKLNKYLTSI